MSPPTLQFTYRLWAENIPPKELLIEVDKEEMTLLSPTPSPFPFWTALSYQQCKNCPLQAEQTAFCPLAVNLVPLIELSKDLISYQKMYVEVVTSQRTCSGETTAQRIVSSMLGLIMATSPCPHTKYLKPMARFHLPLADPDETVYRTTTMFLLAQYFRYKEGRHYAVDLGDLQEIYANLQLINIHLTQRVRAAIRQDAAVNGIVILDALSRTVSWSIEDGLSEMRHLFTSYLDD